LWRRMSFGTAKQRASVYGDGIILSLAAANSLEQTALNREFR